MVQKAKVRPLVLEAHCNLIKSQDISEGITKVNKYYWLNLMDKLKSTVANKTFLSNYIDDNQGSMPGMPCKVLHPRSESCSWYCAKLWKNTLIDIFPVYLALNAIPIAFFKFHHVISKYLTSN